MYKQLQAACTTAWRWLGWLYERGEKLAFLLGVGTVLAASADIEQLRAKSVPGLWEGSYMIKLQEEAKEGAWTYGKRAHHCYAIIRSDDAILAIILSERRESAKQKVHIEMLLDAELPASTMPQLFKFVFHSRVLQAESMDAAGHVDGAFVSLSPDHGADLYHLLRDWDWVHVTANNERGNLERYEAFSLEGSHSVIDKMKACRR